MSVTRSRAIGGLLALGTASAGLVPLASPAQATEIHLTAAMRPTAAYSNAHGHTSYEAEHGTRHFELELRGVARLHGKVVTVRVHGTLVGRVRVSAEGEAHLDRRSGVPGMSVGDVVRVRTGSGRLVSQGTFHFD